MKDTACIVLLAICGVALCLYIIILSVVLIDRKMKQIKYNKTEKLDGFVRERIKLETEYRFEGVNDILKYQSQEINEIKQYLYKLEEKNNVKEKRRSR